MIRFLKHILDRKTGKVLQGQKRSSRWPVIRREHLIFHPVCECCGGKKNLEVHHIKPFHLFSEFELEEDNLVTLCEKKSCHISMGHLYSFKSYNPDIKSDIKAWREKVERRP